MASIEPGQGEFRNGNPAMVVASNIPGDKPVLCYALPGVDTGEQPMLQRLADGRITEDVDDPMDLLPNRGSGRAYVILGTVSEERTAVSFDIKDRALSAMRGPYKDSAEYVIRWEPGTEPVTIWTRGDPIP